MTNTFDPMQTGHGVAATWPDVFSTIHVDATDELVRRIQAELDHREISDWRIFATDFRSSVFSDIDQHLVGLGERESKWVPPLSGPLQVLTELYSVQPAPTERPAGVLYLPRHEVLLVRWKMLCTDSMMWANLEMVATRDISKLVQFEQTLKQLRDDAGRSKWRAIPGAFSEDSFETDRTKAPSLEQLVFPDDVRKRLHNEAVRFFSDETRQLHQQLEIPHRRGLLLYGPPGCGKTSICRAIGASMPSVNAYLLSVNARFDTDDLRYVFHEVARSAPSILVMEDVDLLWGRPDISISVFLNLMDGIVPVKREGMLVVATTNHPENLVAALNNRPGRFSTIEIASPAIDQRKAYLQKALGEISADVIQSIASKTADHSFAHLREIVLLSGSLALGDGTNRRSSEHVLEATDIVMNGSQRAGDTFREKVSGRFGFAG